MQEVLTVSELTMHVKNHLESRFPQVCVQGEISNFKQQASGHLYFTLKDSMAQLSTVFFKGSQKGLARVPKDGDKVILKGELSVYPPRGSYQLIARELTFAGVGELLLQLHALKQKLQEKGYFAKEHKKPLPQFPQTIGVVTSPTGSVIQDILHVLNRRFSGFHLILNPVRVQGEGAAAEIAAAIRQFNEHPMVDLLIVGRGGGSLEDLWAFNEELVAEAIFASKIPIISAVGHETDLSIADLVADVRAPTPSAAAEIATGEKKHYLHFLQQTRERLDAGFSLFIARERERVARFAEHPLFASPYALLGKYSQRLDELRSHLTFSIKAALSQKKVQLSGITRAHNTLNPLALIARKKRELSRLQEHMQAINPKNLLTKGYCILFEENSQSVILDGKKIYPKQRLTVLMQDATLKTLVEEVIR